MNISGGNGAEVTPVPIPNTEVKLCYAENTWWVTAREDKSPPEYILKKEYSSKFGREYIIYSSIAQSVEHAAVNRRVVGSSPTWGAKQRTHLLVCFLFGFLCLI